MAETINIQEFKGLNTDDSRLTLQNGQTPDSENVRTDEGPGITNREGFVQFSTVSASDMWILPHSNGTRYLIIASSNTMKADIGTRAFTISVSTIPTSVRTVGTVMGDRFYFANTIDGLKYADFSGSIAAVGVASPTLTVDNLVTHKNCLWASGKAAQPRTIFKSKFDDGTSWNLAVDPVVTDPAQFIIAGALDQRIIALYASFQDRLIWMKANSFGGILGNSRADFTVRIYNDQVGTAFRDSIHEAAGFLRWQGPERTIWEFDGATYYEISRRNKFSNSSIKSLLATIQQGESTQRSNFWTIQADFNLGMNNLTSNTVTPASVVLSTWTDTDTTAANFGAGTTFTNVSTTAVPGSVILSTNNIDLSNNSFETGSGATADNWTADPGGVSSSWIVGRTNSETTAQDGSYTFAGMSDPGGSLTCVRSQTVETNYIHVYDSDDGIFSPSLSVPFTASTSWQQISIDLSSYIGQTVRIGFTVRRKGDGPPPCGIASSIGEILAVSDFFVANGQPMTCYVKAYGTGNYRIAYDLFQGGRNSILTGSFVSRSVDSTLRTPLWLATGASWVASNQNLTIKTQTSDDGVSWDSLVAWSTGSAPSSNTKRYIRYQVDFSTNSNGTGFPRVDDVTFAARQSTGSWVSDSVSMGSPSGFGVFEANHSLNDGTITYGLYTDSDSAKTVTNGVPVAGTWVSSQAITSLTIPALSTAAYVFVASNFSISAATQNPTSNDITIRWLEGSPIPVPSVFYDHRSWFPVAINAATNNRVIVYDKNRQWQRDKGISADATLVHDGNILFGNTSGIWQAETGNSDNGSAIASYYTTPSFSPSGPNLISVYNDLYFTTENSAETVGTMFRIDGIGTEYSLSNYNMNTTAGFQNVRIPFPFTQLQQGRNIDFKFSVTGATAWRILAATLDFTPDRVAP